MVKNFESEKDVKYIIWSAISFDILESFVNYINTKLSKKYIELGGKYKGKKGGNVVNTVVKVPYSNMQMAGMDTYFSQPSYRMALEVNIARHSQLPGTSIGFFNQNGVQTSSISWDFATGKSSGDVIRYTDVNGKVQSINAQDAAKMIDDAGRTDTKTGKPTHTFRTIKDIE